MGQACHGNSPWHGRSALDAAMIQAYATEMLREHFYPGAPPDAATTLNYTFTDTGPDFPGTIADTTTIWYVGRFVTSEDASEGLRKITNCAKAAALATDTTVSMEVITATNHKIPNRTLAKIMHDNFVSVGPPVFSEEEQQLAKDIQRKIGVKESGLATQIRPFDGGYSVVCDTGEYSWNAPYATAWIAMGPENIGWHNWGVTLCAIKSMGKKSMEKAANVIALTGTDLFLNPSVVREAKAELNDRLEGRTYKCLLPEDYTPPLDLYKDTMEKYYAAVTKKEMK
jgi:aminobenzoyl-glutamate utilization protein B